MKLDRVSSVVYAGTVRPSSAEKYKLPSPGETAKLIFEETSGGDLLATLDGIMVRLTGVAEWSQGLQPGDTLLIRVLRTEPSLQIELYGPPPPRGDVRTALRLDQAAMRVDQAALRQVAWHTENGVALAKTWQLEAQVRWSLQARWGQRVAGAPAGDQRTVDVTTGGQRIIDAPAGGPRMLETETAVDRRLRPAGFEPWGFPVYMQDGRRMTLGLAEDDSPRHRHRRRPLALRLALTAPVLGRLVLEVQWSAGGGIQLVVAVERAESWPGVRACVSDIAIAMRRANLRLVRCRLVQGGASHEQLGAVPVDPFATRSFEEELSAPLFRALAETAVVFMEHGPGASGGGAGSPNRTHPR